LEVDLDRLADYVGGALDGTPDAEAVRELVSSDDAWAEAYASLVAADALVRVELRALGGLVPVPVDVVKRLDRALAQPAVPTATVHRLDARHRWRKAAIGLSAAAAAIVIIGLATVGVLRGMHGVASSDSAGSTGAMAPQKAAGAPPQVLTSDRDYSAATLGQVGRPSTLSGQGLAGPESDTGTGTAPRTDNLAGPLARLTDPTARESCLTAIVGEYGGQVSTVDFARFNGTPALVAVVTGSARAPGARWIVVVGPACGEGSSSTDERYSGAF
jgi:hypothetical protein